MTQSEIDLLQHELLLRGVNMAVPSSVYHMDWDKALSVCLDLYSGFSFQHRRPMPLTGGVIDAR